MPSRQGRKIESGAQQFLESGEQVLYALVAAARGHTQTMAGSMHVGSTQSGRAFRSAQEVGLELASPMGLVITQRRLLTLRIGTPIGLGIGGAVKDLLSAVPIGKVESIDVKRLAAGFRIVLHVDGAEIALEANAASGAKELPEALERAKAAA